MATPFHPSSSMYDTHGAPHAVWDPLVLQEYVGNDFEVKNQLLSKFLMRTAETLLQMNSALLAEDYAQLTSLSHRLKSSALTVGAQALAAHAQSLETLARAHQRSVTAVLFESLKFSEELTRQAISQALSFPQPHGNTPH